MMTFRIFVLLFSCIASKAFAQQQCEPSKRGAADEIGAANYVTPERVLNATALVKEERSHGLGIFIESGMPAFPPRDTQLQIVQPEQQFGRKTTLDYAWPMSYNDDVV